MKKYNKKLILDYVYGNEIVGYDIDELENDHQFMIEVINYTNDKNMYNLCSEKVKNNYEFIKYMINKFKNDLDFICYVADGYLEKDIEEINEFELIVIMCNLTEKSRAEQRYKYFVMKEAIYSTLKLKLELIKKNIDKEFMLKEIQQGFCIIVNEYNSSKIVMDFYAKRFIKNIIDENNINLELLIHKKFTTYEEFEKYGINSYLINFLNNYDSFLGDYASCNLNVLDDIKEKIYSFKYNWNDYNSLIESEKYNYLIDSVYEYMDKYGLNCSFTETEIKYYIAEELGITSKLMKYDCCDMISKEIINDMLSEGFIIDKTTMNFADLKHYNNIKKIMKKILYLGNLNDLNENNDDDHTPMVKVLKKFF